MPKKSGKGLQQKVGPFPLWVWIAGGVGLYLWHTGALSGLMGGAPTGASVSPAPQAPASPSHHQRPSRHNKG